MLIAIKKKLSIAIGQIAAGFETTSEVLFEGYTATPGVAQKLNEAIRVDSDFLKKINVLGVKEIKGEKILIGTTGPVSRRTDTSGGAERKARPAQAMLERSYELYKVETDVAIRHELLNSWAHIEGKTALSNKIRSQVKAQIIEDRINCGWNGVSVDAVTDPAVTPDLSNLNIGWLQKARIENPDAYFVEKIEASGKITIGTGGDHANLPALVSSLIKAIPKKKRKKLVVFISDDLRDEYEQKIWAQFGERPSEEEKLTANALLGRVANLPMDTPEDFPDGTIFICSYKNLSLYWQLDSWKTSSGDNIKGEQYEDLNSRNEGYILEDAEAVVLAENIEYVEAA